MTHFNHPCFPFVHSDGHGAAGPTMCMRGSLHEQQSAWPPLQHSSIPNGVSAASVDLTSSVQRSEPGNVVLPLTDSGEVDRLAVLCHCAYASQFSEDPEDIFKYACIDVKLNQPGDQKRDGDTPEVAGPFPEATLVRIDERVSSCSADEVPSANLYLLYHWGNLSAGSANEEQLIYTQCINIRA